MITTNLGTTFIFGAPPRGLEVDFVLYGPRGILAIEVKHSRRISARDLSALKAFGRDYPEARMFLIYMGEREESRQGYSDHTRMVGHSVIWENPGKSGARPQHSIELRPPTRLS